MNNSGRIVAFDAIKLFAIFMVLWGHATQYFYDGAYYNNVLYRIIYSFHMPLFMVIVGFFATTLPNKSLLDIILKKGRQLLLPALTFCILWYFARITGTLILGRNPHWNILESLNLFWFLKSAFICCILYSIAVKITPNRKWIGVLITLVISQFIEAFSVYLMYPQFLIGVALNLWYAHFKKFLFFIVGVCGIIWIGLLIFWDASFWDYSFVTESNFSATDGYKILYRIAIGMTGATFFIALFHIAIKPNDYFCKYGQFTLGIYLLQTFILEMALPLLIPQRFKEDLLFDTLFTPITALLVMALCIYIITLFNRHRLLALLTLGKKYTPKNAVSTT